MTDEIKVKKEELLKLCKHFGWIPIKKENVLKAFKEIEGCSDTSALQATIKMLFPEAFEEEKKESELDKILCGCKLCLCYDIAKTKKQIIDIAKEKVDEVVKNHRVESWISFNLKQKLDEM